MLDYIAGAMKNITRKKMRSGLTMLGIAIGVMSVVLISIISDIGKEIVIDELESMGAGGILVSANSKKENVELKLDGLEYIKEMDSVELASPLVISYSTAKIKKTLSDCVIWGIDNDISDIVSLEVIHGRMITQHDVDTMNPVCLVDESYAQNTYQRSNIVGKNLEIMIGGSYHSFEIVGVIQTGGNILQSLMGDVVPCFTYLPYTTMQSLSNEVTLGQIAAKAKETDDTSAVSAQIVSELSSYYGTSDAVSVQDLNTQMDTLNVILDLVTLVLTIIAGISLLVSGLSIMTVMLVSVSERTREIGIKKSIGASRTIILGEFLTESMLVSLFGALGGSILAIVLTILGCTAFGISVIINVSVILGCIAFALFVGVLFGVYPALKASKLKPVDALRHE